jgi:hypothetical protein
MEKLRMGRTQSSPIHPPPIQIMHHQPGRTFVINMVRDLIGSAADEVTECSQFLVAATRPWPAAR